MRRYRHPYSLGAKFRTPWTMRLDRELTDLKQLQADSTILDFKVSGDPPDKYLFRFNGKSLVPGGRDGVTIGDHQEVEIELGSDYPRKRPNVRWLTPIAHPNINSGGAVCFGNFASNWSPSVRLADLTEILWDYARLAILNPHSGYGGSGGSKTWAELDQKYKFPVDKRLLRDKILPNDVGSSILRPEGGPDDIVILNDSESDCQFLE